MAVNPLAVGGGVVVAAAAIGGGVYASGALSSDNKQTPPPTAETSPVSIKKAGEYTVAGTSSKFGHKFSYYFLSEGSDKNTKEWNRKAGLLKAKKDSLTASSFFDSIKQDPTGATLKAECKKQYEKTATDYTDDAKWKEVWEFCSLGDEQPGTINEIKDSLGDQGDEATEKRYANASPGNSKIGESLKGKVVSTTYKKNQWFWNLKEEEFKDGDNKTGFFNKERTNRKSIQELCKEAYGKTSGSTDDDTNTTNDATTKHCTLKGK